METSSGVSALGKLCALIHHTTRSRGGVGSSPKSKFHDVSFDEAPVFSKITCFVVVGFLVDHHPTAFFSLLQL